MEEQNKTDIQKKTEPEKERPLIDFQQLWMLFRLNWHWCIISMIAIGLMTYIYMYFKPTKVTVSNKVLIIDEGNQGSAAAGIESKMLSAIPFGLGSSIGGSGDIDTEIEILKSNTLIRDIVNDLGLYAEYRFSSWGRSYVVYKTQPLTVSMDPAHLKWMDDELLTCYRQINLTINKSDAGYQVEPVLVLNKKETELPTQLFAKLPATLQTEYGNLTIEENGLLSSKERSGYQSDYSLKVTIVPPMTRAMQFISSMVVEKPSKMSSGKLLNVMLQDENHIRAIDFIDALVDHYNEKANKEKDAELLRNERFANKRMAKLDLELGSSDADWERYKKVNQIIDPEADAQDVLTKKSTYEVQLVELGTQIQLHDFLSDFVNNPDNLFELIPAAITPQLSSGIGGSGSSGASASSATSSGSEGTSSLLARHNSLVDQRRDLLKSLSEKSPQVIRLTEAIRELQPIIRTSLKRDRQALIIQRNALEKEYGKSVARVSSAPKMERELTDIARQREIKQGVYLAMLQKREQTAMDLAKKTLKGQLLGKTQVVASTADHNNATLLIAMIAGALLPMVILFLLDFLKLKIETRKDIENSCRYPVIGEIPLSQYDDAIRTLRTNLLLNLEEGQKAILVASHSTGDGKTFLAQQLTDSLNAIGKKATLINADFRSLSLPKGHPSDILASADFALQIAQAKASSDYVILDTPALDKYVDAYQIAKFADATLFVVKAESTPKSALESLSSDTRLPNIMLALNAIDMSKKKNQFVYQN